MSDSNTLKCEQLSSQLRETSQIECPKLVQQETLKNTNEIPTKEDQKNVQTLPENPQVNYQISRNQDNQPDPNHSTLNKPKTHEHAVCDPTKTAIQTQKINQNEHQVHESKQVQQSFQKLSVEQNKKGKKSANFSKKWQQFSREYKFNPEFGYLIDPKIKLSKPEFTQFNSIVQRLPLFKNSSDLREEIQKLPEVKMETFDSIQQAFKFRDMLTYMEGRYVCLERSLGKKDTEITMPFPLSKYLIDASNLLKIKLGPTVAISSNWGFTQNINEAELPELTMENLKLQYYFSEHTKEEHVFLGTSVVACFYLAKVIKNCYNINQIIENDNIPSNDKMFMIIKSFEEIEQKWTKIYDLMVSLSDILDPDIYYHQIRPHLMGFENLKFENYEGSFTSGGGSAGEDPCYQLFERAMGVQISEAFSKIQVKLKEGMYQSHIQFQDYFKNHSSIKTYCLKNDFLTEAYQRVLKTYTKMNCFHNIFIKKYILAYVSAENHPYVKGAGGNNIMDIMNRWKVLDEKNSLGMRPSNNSI